ncbi:UDP-N-acetylglucosamine 1-carboxyvinyltransferase [Candidatus Falkowbacteria bacterium]|nr:UDP-N-acetylglucosamine 1-carboxyvinyltransferase [Candidatus Falkowbacteria bacterium]
MSNAKKSQVNILDIKGGCQLEGEVFVRGAKNTVPKNMVAALLTSDSCVIKNIAHIVDVDIMCDMIEALGSNVRFTRNHSLQISASSLAQMPLEQTWAFANKSRIPILTCGPLLARNGHAIVPALGGCQIGDRPIDFHIEVLKALGARIEIHDTHLEMFANRLRGAKIRLPYPSVGATEQVLLSSVLANGVTELSNAAIEPEIMDLIAVLQKMGAIISVDTHRVITIHGVDKLSGFNHKALPDRLEAASWACLAAATKGRIFVRGAEQMNMLTFLNAFRQAGGAFEITESGIEFWRADKTLKAMALETDVHPGFMTDWQQPFAVMLTQANGLSVIHETVYEGRFGYIEAFKSMGAQIQLYQRCLGQISCRFANRNALHSAVIAGPTTLRGAEIHIPDLRGGFSYIIAALVANGASRLHNIRLIHRGYENIIEKLRALKANIQEE